MTGDPTHLEARVIEEATLDLEGVRVELIVGELNVTVWFHDRSSDGAARGATPTAMRKAIQIAREYRRSNREVFERLFEELERRDQP